MKNQSQITATEMHTKVESWSLPTDSELLEYTSNQMIHAYTTGVKEGMEQDEKLFQKQIKDNSKSAGEDTHKVIAHLKSVGINSISAHLRIESRYSIEVLITVSDSDFAKDLFSEIYSFVNALQEKSKTDFYTVIFSFINRSSEFDIDMVKSDGFMFTFQALEKK